MQKKRDGEKGSERKRELTEIKTQEENERQTKIWG
jgi:hypothetical protein